MNTRIRVGLSVFFLLIFLFAGAQQKTPAVTPAATSPLNRDTSREVNLIRSDLLRFKKTDSSDLQILTGNAMLRQGKTFFRGDSIVMNKQLNVIEVFGNIHINDADSVNVYSQYLIYYGNTKIANLKKSVKLTDGKATLTTEELEYDLNTKTGTYLNGGKIVNASSTLTSKEGYYYAETRDAYFKKNVQLVDPDYTMATDTLLYNANTQIATFIAPTTINDGKSIIRTSDGYYDMNKGLANFGKRPVIDDSTQHITADIISFDKATGEGYAEGNFIYVDTSQGVTVLAEKSFFNRDKKTFLATLKPVMIIKQDKDSLFVTGDTLYSGIKLDTIYVKDTTVKISDVVVEDDVSPEISIAPKGHPEPGNSEDNHRQPIKKLPDNILKKPGPPPARDSAQKLTEHTITKDSVQAVAKPALLRDSLLAKNENLPSKDSSAADKLSLSDSSIADKQVIIKDTVKAVKIPDIDRVDSVRFFQAYHHVKIFSDSMQAVCDSMLFSGTDSIFRLYTNPIVWSKGSQITGDTIHLYTKNKKPSRVEVFENAFSISKSNDEFFNQLKGNVINGYFKDGEIEHIRAKGNAESLYYMQDDDSAYTGANYAQADLINLYFNKRELQKITWIHQVEGGFYPVMKVPAERQKFRNFKWQEALRPKTRLELFE